MSAAFVFLATVSGALESSDTRSLATGVAAIIALATFLGNAHQQAVRDRKQHTIRMLMDARLSPVFRKLLKDRTIMFPPGTRIPVENYERIADWPAEGPERRSREALVAILNYYEFIAAGIYSGDLDEQLLRRTIRAIMCNLIDDARDLIVHFQRENPALYVHVVRLFNQWRDPRVHARIVANDAVFPLAGLRA